MCSHVKAAKARLAMTTISTFWLGCTLLYWLNARRAVVALVMLTGAFVATVGRSAGW